MNNLIRAIETLAQTAFDIDTVCRSDVIDLIKEAMEGKVLVPAKLIQEIDEITEAGFEASPQIDELCLLLPTSDTHEAN